MEWEIPHFVFLFIRWWAFGFFLLFLATVNAAMNIHIQVALFPSHWWGLKRRLNSVSHWHGALARFQATGLVNRSGEQGILALFLMLGGGEHSGPTLFCLQRLPSASPSPQSEIPTLSWTGALSHQHLPRLGLPFAHSPLLIVLTQVPSCPCSICR